MHITDIRGEYYRWKRAIPIANGKHVYPYASLGVVRVETNSGLYGIGYTNTYFEDRFSECFDYFKAQLLGEDPLNTERLWQKMWAPKMVGRRGMSTRLISAIDIALWDIKAKSAGMPLFRLLGGAKDRIPVYAAGGYYAEGKGLDGLQEEVRQYVDDGCRAVKMKVGAVDMSEDVLRVQAVREAIGPDVKLMVDANCAYSAVEALRFAGKIERFNPYWFEEPVEPDDYAGMRMLYEKSAIPVAAGENEYTKYGFRDLMDQGRVRILNVDVYLSGGVTEFMKIAAFSQAYGGVIAPHGAHTVHSHLTCAIPNSLILEYYPQRFDDVGQQIYTRQLTLNDDGTVSPPETPGHGFEPNYEILNTFRLC